MSKPISGKLRALVLRRTDCDSGVIDRLAQEHGLEIVYTVVTDTTPQLAALIAIHHMLESDAEAVVVPHLTEDEVRRNRSWQLVVTLTRLVTAVGVVDR
ncbi:hypothetical protein AB0H42_09995 [Nocardia sp. NPDC050799]|uniref:hypothetical protein n=1 Tax=Nocardia sp. NPDC050799 TaxID=3154842 RepID=UPI0033CD8938